MTIRPEIRYINNHNKLSIDHGNGSYVSGIKMAVSSSAWLHNMGSKDEKIKKQMRGTMAWKDPLLAVQFKENH